MAVGGSGGGGNGHEVRGPAGRVFHVRAAPPVPANTRGATVANRLNQRRRQDSDGDASGSVDSETTVASGTTPLTK